MCLQRLPTELCFSLLNDPIHLCRIFCKRKKWGDVPTASKGTCLTFETCARIENEILSKVTSIEEDEEDCEEDTDEIEDLI